MKIKGIQNLTLIDYPGKIACTIFLFGCNFRCGFCHNPELVLAPDGKEITQKEILEFLKKRRGQLEGVCFTGGEPLATLEKEFVKSIKEMGYFIKIDTNGSFPSMLKEFLDEELVDYVAMDLKSSFENYSAVVGVAVNINKIKESIKLIFYSGVDYEFRTTVVPRFHDDGEIAQIGKDIFSLLKQKPKKYFLQGFQNNGKFIDAEYRSEKNVPKEKLDRLKKVVGIYFEEVGIRF